MSTVVAGQVVCEVVPDEVAALLDRVEQLQRDNALLNRAVRGLQAERDLLAAQGRLDRDEIARLRAANARLGADNQRLTARLEDARRQAKRQAAPFSKGDPKPAGRRRRPGRKPGQGYGAKAHRRIPDHVDEVVAVPPPSRCDRAGCGGQVHPTGDTVSQWVTDIPKVAPHVTRFDLVCGRCAQCGKAVRGRHGDQSSDALGAAASQVGPNALALAAKLRHGYGLSHAKTCQALADFAGIALTPGGLVQALHRMAARLAPTDAALVATVGAAPVVSPDETGWRVGGHRRWLWAFATATVVVYRILAGRGYDQAVGVLGAGYAGVLVRDGWAPYRRFAAASHQTCLAHLDRRCRELIADSTAGQARVPHLVKAIIGDALAVRDRRDAGELTGDQVAAQAAALNHRLDVLLGWQPTHQPNRKLLAHLGRERAALLTFLDHPGIDATNWRAEQAIRPAVVNRKAWGGNSSDRGAATTQTIAGVLATCALQQRDAVAVLVPVLRARGPTLAALDYSPTPLPASVTAA